MLTRRDMSRLFAVGGLALAAAPATAGPVASRRSEVDALRRFAEGKHPRGLEASLNRAWRETWAALARDADALSDGQYVVRLRRALGWFEDGHTTVLPFEFTGGASAQMKHGPFGKALPLRARAFDDGMWVVRAKDEATPLLGAKVVRVSGQPVEKAVAAMIASWPAESPAWGHNWAWLLLSSVGLLHGFNIVSGAADAPLVIDAVDAAGASKSVTVRPREEGGEGLAPLPRTETAVERLATEIGRTNFVRTLQNDSVLYLSIDAMDDIEGYTFEAFTDEVVAAAASPKLKRMVIDLRRNGGGDNYKGETLRRELARSRFNTAGGLYVLTAPQTFSAAQNLANRLERETLALFVGEPTGSAPNLHGDPELFTGAASGVTAMVSTLRWYDSGPHDKRRWIFPDVFVPTRFADWAAGRDMALDAAIADAPDAASGFKSRVFYYKRPSQAQEWRPFWRSA